MKLLPPVYLDLALGRSANSEEGEGEPSAGPGPAGGSLASSSECEIGKLSAPCALLGLGLSALGRLKEASLLTQVTSIIFEE